MTTHSLPLTDFAALPPHCDNVVIGSGPGGAITGTTLTEGGRQVVMLEEGSYYPQQQYTPFSMQEMQAAYRRNGMTVALGKSAINYVEARCIGGGSEINSGLYHRPPAAALARWAKHGVIGADSHDIINLCEENEADLAIRQMPNGQVQAASQRLAMGADSLGWSCPETPRWHQYDNTFSADSPGGIRQSMARTFLPRFIKAGGQLVANCEVQQLQQTSSGWKIHARYNGTPVSLRAKQIFVAAGAVRTPLLLKNSGFKQHIGQSLRLHVFTRVIAEFDEPINSENAGIGPHQVDALAPRLRFGCSVTTPAHLAAAFTQCGNHTWLKDHEEKWRNRAAYYVTIGSGIGSVRSIGGSEAVFYRLSNNDYYDLADGIRALTRMLFRAGAKKVLPVINGSETLTSENDLWRLPRPLAPERACLTSVHLMGSCPMTIATDSYGVLYNTTGLTIADASLFYDSPNVNPQGTLMAFARRNARHYLSL